MFCPYIRKSYLNVTTIHYNGDNIEDGHAVYEKYENIQCKKEQCGAWYDGRCRYNEYND